MLRIGIGFRLLYCCIRGFEDFLMVVEGSLGKEGGERLCRGHAELPSNHLSMRNCGCEHNGQIGRARLEVRGEQSGM